MTTDKIVDLAITGSKIFNPGSLTDRLFYYDNSNGNSFFPSVQNSIPIFGSLTKLENLTSVSSYLTFDNSG